MVDIEKIRAFFGKDIFCKENGIVIDEVCEEYACISVPVEARHLNADGFAQGGLIYTLADFAFAVHAGAFGNRCVTRSAEITYVRPAACKKLIAKAVPINRGKKMCLYKVEVLSDAGKTVAFATVNGCVLDINPEMQ